MRPVPRSRRAVALTIAWLLPLALAASCSITEPTSRTAASNDLASNLRRWTSSGLREYDFEYRLSCFCAYEDTEPVLIRVRSGRLDGVTRLRDGMPAIASGRWPTIDELFASVEDALAQTPERLDVDYDPTYGYPRSIILDFRAMIADDESSRSVTNFRAVR